jgi:hypothetical protein
MCIQFVRKARSQYQIARSVRLRASAGGYFNRTLGSPTDNKKWTFAVCAKRGLVGSNTYTLFGRYIDANNFVRIDFLNQAFRMYQYQSGIDILVASSALIRDPMAHCHLQVAVDIANATASERIKLYYNGVLLTPSGSPTYPGTSVNSLWNAAAAGHIIGGLASGEYDGLLSDGYFIDGQALDPTSFITGTGDDWVPKSYTGTYGTNGFHLTFSDNSAATAAAIGADSSGNGNNWTPNNISVTAGATNDSLVDTPTNYGTDTGAGGEVRGNYATWNPLDIEGGANTFSAGNLAVATGSLAAAFSTAKVSSGKWYGEITIAAGATPQVGVAKSPIGTISTNALGQSANGYTYAASGNKANNNSFAAYGASYTAGDVIGIALDMDAGTLTFYKNGVSQGQAFSGLSGEFAFAISNATGVNYVNFGQRPFAYTAPSGFKALCTQNATNETITTSGTFTGNANADGPAVWLNGVPTAMTINGNAVTFGTHADKLAGGFKLRSASASYNASGSNTYSVSSTGAAFKYARAQKNP